MFIPIKAKSNYKNNYTPKSSQCFIGQFKTYRFLITILGVFVNQIYQVVGQQAQSVSPQIVNCHIHALINSYDTLRYNGLINRARIPIELNSSKQARFMGAEWLITLTASKEIPT
jgi:hypothetical protein